MKLSDKPFCCDEVRWVQMISTNYRQERPARVDAGLSHYLDPLKPSDPSNDPFYWDTDDTDYSVEQYKSHKGYHLYFYDRVQRIRLHTEAQLTWPATVPTITWIAQLYLVCVNKDAKSGGGTIRILSAVRYGFKIDRAKGNVTLDPIQEHGLSQIFTTTFADWGHGWALE